MFITKSGSVAQLAGHLRFSSKVDAGGTAANVCSSNLALGTAPLKLHFDNIGGGSSALYSQCLGLSGGRLPKATIKIAK